MSAPHHSDSPNVVEAIEALAASRGVPVATVLAELGIKVVTFYKWRNGTHKPSGSLQATLAKLLGGGSPPGPPPAPVRSEPGSHLTLVEGSGPVDRSAPPASPETGVACVLVALPLESYRAIRDILELVGASIVVTGFSRDLPLGRRKLPSQRHFGFPRFRLPPP